MLHTGEGADFCYGRTAMCRTRTHKYIRRRQGIDELYDLVSDPLEQNNLINNRENAGLLTQLKERMLNWYMETADVSLMEQDRR